MTIRTRLKFIVVAFLTASLTVSCNTSSDPKRPDMCLFSIFVSQHNNKTGEYELVSPRIGGDNTVVPSDYFTPSYLSNGVKEKLKLKAVKLDGPSVDFLVSWGDEERKLTATIAKNSHVKFADGKWKVGISIHATNVSPFLDNEQKLSAPVQLYLTEIQMVNQGETDSRHIQGRKIVKKTEIKDEKVIKKIKSVLMDSDNYWLQGAMCFHPRTALSFGAGDSLIEILFCRECSWVYIYDRQTEHALEYGLGSEMYDLVVELRKTYFPGEKDN